MPRPQIITIRVHPNAQRTRIKETMVDGSWKIDIAAPPDDGEANAELVRFLSEHFGVAKGGIEILSGQTSRKKIIRIVSTESSPAGRRRTTSRRVSRSLR